MNNQRILIYGFVVLVLLSCNSQSKIERILNDKTILYPISIDGKWGFTNNSGQQIIECQFDTVNFFSYGLSAVSKNGEFGYIDSNGKWFIKPQYERAFNFDLDCATVIKNGKETRIRRNNKRCEKKQKFTQDCGIALFSPLEIVKHSIYKDGKYAITNTKFINETKNTPRLVLKDTTDFIFDEIIEFSSYNLIVKKGNKYGVYDSGSVGRVEKITDDLDFSLVNRGYKVDTIFFQYDEIEIEYLQSEIDAISYEFVFALFKFSGNWGMIDGWGQVKILPQYKSIKIIDNKFALVEYEDNLHGVVNILTEEEYFERTN